MLRLKSLTISKFRSFKHAELHFSKGFTCVVGPNGSGKSSICYSLMFGLGESSLKRLDGARMLADLINNKVSYAKGAIPKAYVKIDLEGDEKYEIIRYARADGKSLYKVNGKKYSKQEVVEILKKHKFDVNDTNTIAQSEINRLANLNPKETRQLIDEASGIKEFEAKKQESMRELEQVTQSVSSALMILHERKGFLEDLKEQKEAAEKYLDMRQRLNSINYSKTLLRLQDAQKSFDKHSSEMAISDAQKQKLLVSMESLTSKISALDAQRQKLSEELMGKSASSSDVTRSLEVTKSELTKIAFEIDNCAKRIDEHRASIVKFEQLCDEITKSMAVNSSSLSDVEKRIGQISPDVSRFESNGKVDPAEIEDKIKHAQNRLEELQEAFNSINDEIIGLNNDSYATEAKVTEIIKSIDANKEIEKQERESAAKANEKYGELSKIFDQTRLQIANMESKTSELSAQLSTIDLSLLEYKQKKFEASSRESAIIDKISREFDEKFGFYGSASQLCTYESKYATAIEVSAGARLGYFVVDSISVASKIIDYMKSKDLGRATFIPIKDLSKGVVGPSEDLGSKALPLLSVVKSDARFKNVFEYIFNNTYVVDDISTSKKLGVGRHRYVTLSGELVEQSGVVSGGNLKGRMSLSTINSKLEELEKSKLVSLKEKTALDAQLAAARKEHAHVDMEIEKLKSNEADHNSSADLMSSHVGKAIKELSAEREKLEKLKAKIIERTRARAANEASMRELKDESQRLYGELTELSKRLSRSGMSKAEKERLEKLKVELEELKAKKASLEKENEMKAARAHEIEAEISQLQKEIKKQEKEKSGKEEAKKKLEIDRAELELQISKSTRASEDALKKMRLAELDISTLSAEKGKLLSQIDLLDKDITEHKIHKVSLETRIGDFKAEIATFDSSLQPVQGSIEEMEKEAAILGSKISDLGNVNLKAPEVYDAKMKDVQEANFRVETLNSERDAVMKMIEEIDKKKFDIFMQTFSAVSAHFSEIYKYVSPDNAQLELDNPKDPFNSGLVIRIAGDKSRRGVRQMSGGQKTLLTLMLMFAIHMYKPSSIYIFDEVDAALDKENSKKLSHIIKQLSSQSQFIVVSHNDSLVTEADVAIGVVFDKAKNESKAVGLDISSITSGADAGTLQKGAL